MIGVNYRDHGISITTLQLLEDSRPHSYCDACLALHFEVSLEEARTVALVLAATPSFMREHRKCNTCTRSVETTSARVGLRQPS